MVYGEPSIDDFEFIKPLTSGGFGKVYLGSYNEHQYRNIVEWFIEFKDNKDSRKIYMTIFTFSEIGWNDARKFTFSNLYYVYLLI